MNGLLLSVQVESVSTRKDRTLKIVLGTQELSPSKAGELMGLMNKIAVTYISMKDINQSEIDQVDKLDPEFGGKTQSQRMRNVLYKTFEHNSEGFKDFNSYYQAKTEQIIDHLKTKLPA